MSWRRRALVFLAAAVALYVLIAYAVLPMAWRHYEHQPGLARLAMVTQTGDGIPGDPLNVGLVGAKADVICAMHAAGWVPADPVTLRTSLEIVGSVLLDRPYSNAPVSPLYYEGRREDLAFEKAIGRSAARRHHVRFWQVLSQGEEGRPVWLGAGTRDIGVELSRDTGQVTHRIAPDIDAERDLLTADLRNVEVVEATYQVAGIGPTLNGRNGGGDRYFTDGEIEVSRLVKTCGGRATAPARLASPASTSLKNSAWRSLVRPFLPAS